jgi:hypothetical protein
MGFVLEPEEAQRLIQVNPRNRDVLYPYLNGEDVNSRPDHSPRRWVINFTDWPIERAMDYPECFRIVEERVKPERTRLKDGSDEFVLRKPLPQKWWIYADKRPELYRTIASLERFLIRSRVSNLNSWAFVSGLQVVSDATVVVAEDTYTWFSLLQNSLQSEWISTYASSMRTDIRYTPTDCFETFPFPIEINQLESIGLQYYRCRQAVMLNHDEGMTKTYNRFHSNSDSFSEIIRLRQLQVEMDNAVAAAYGWTDLDLAHGFHETKQGVRFTISETARREVLSRLLKLNHERFAEEKKQGLHDKKKAVVQPKEARKQPSLFDSLEDT